MNNVMKNNSPLSCMCNRPSMMPVSSLFLMILFVVLSSCGANIVNPQTEVTPSVTEVSQTTAESQTTGTSQPQNVAGYPIKVYFPKLNQGQDADAYAVFPVDRVSPTRGVATYALQLLIAGPTVEERDQGYYSELNSMLSGPSECGEQGGPDFRLMLDKRGTVAETGTATVQFCRDITGIGSIADGIVRDQIGKTLEQFPTIKKVLILRKDGYCFQNETDVGKYCESYQP